MKYNKVRGILRAKQGSQIPKFLVGGNPYMVGSPLPSTLQDATSSFNPSILNSNLYNLPENSKLNVPLTNFEQDLWNSRNGELSRTAINNTNFKIPESIKTTPSLTLKLGIIGKGLGKKIGNFANANQGMITSGINMISDKLFGGTKNSSEFDTVNGALGFALKIKGPIGWYATAAKVGLNAINKIGASTVDDTYINQDVANKAGGSYADTMTLGLKAMSNNGVEFGLFNRGGYKAAKRARNEYLKLQGVLKGIVNEADNLRVMVSDLNYLGYQMLTDGGFDLLNMGIRAKQGGTLDTKINLVKSRKFNLIINVDTKLVEEFKLGGVIESEWEPIIEDLWEPIIEIPEFKDGGKTKEELEAPEIEETNQKNLIPEGALHKNKHHMEHTEGLTLKGIPVVDNDGEQQAEIELNEIIFTLEVTKKLEELYKDGSDEAAIEAGKLLVKEILFNTDDRTGLIAKCEKGGKL